MLRSQLIDILNKSWPMLIIFTVIISSIRIAYLKVNREKFVFYKELLDLAFMLYILVLFFIVTAQDPISNSISSYNLVPFREMFRYNFGSALFYRNIIGNLLLFIPFGVFIPYYLKSNRFSLAFVLSLISSVTIEFAQRLIVGRVFDVDDIILNVMGGMIGYFIFIIIDTIGSYLPRFFRSDWFLNLLFLVIVVILALYLYKIDIWAIKVIS